MAMHGGETNEGQETPFSDVSQGGIIEAINLVKITRKGGELEDLGADGRGVRSEARDLCSGIRIHHEEGNETLRRKPREDIYIYIHIFCWYNSARREAQCQTNNEGKDDRADDADGRALGVERDCGQRA